MRGVCSFRRGSEAVGITNLPAANPLTGGRAVAASHLLAPRLTNLIRNAELGRSGVNRRCQEHGEKREDQAHKDTSDLLKPDHLLSRQPICKLSHVDSR
jgi:hypothetical protein